MNTVKQLGTHSGTFHADEVTGIMLLKNFVAEFRGAEIVRTRDPVILKSLDVIIDVGGEYDHARNRYDHHQKGFSETFSETHQTKLSSAGLVYKHFGEEILKSAIAFIFYEEKSIDQKYFVDMTLKDLQSLKLMIYNDFIEYLDAIDNGIPQYPKDVAPRYRSHYTDMASRINRLNGKSLLKEERSQDELFVKAMEIAKEEFLFEVKWKFLDKFVSFPLVKEAFAKRNEIDKSGKILYLESPCAWKEALFQIEKETKTEGQHLYVLYHDRQDGNFRMQAVPLGLGSYELRRPLKEEWRGLRDEELKKVSGIKDCVFCHINGFIGVGTTLSSVLEMAKLSLPRFDEENK